MNIPRLHKGISNQDRSETKKIQKKAKSQKRSLNISANVVIGFPLLRPEVKRKEQSPLNKKKEVVHCLPFAACQETKATDISVLRMEPAETTEDQTVLRKESAGTIEDQTVLRKESAETTEDQTVLGMEEEAKVSQSPSQQVEASTSQSTGTQSAGTAEDLSAQTEATALVSAYVPQSVCGKGINLTTHNLFIPEQEMNRLLYEKDMRIHFLVQENYDLIGRAQNVKQEITRICGIKRNIGMRLSEQRMLESNAY
ncbi:unnamed protein product [Pleuronectes platessa]|uniref:Uncharacterized protein n=1 Tax=Pleuronectes platessa TaxID=8262 RepID=A0A9N7YIE1_PLEPL|nr:unnamed protein product [Pleuronectes platessa]